MRHPWSFLPLGSEFLPQETALRPPGLIPVIEFTELYLPTSSQVRYNTTFKPLRFFLGDAIYTLIFDHRITLNVLCYEINDLIPYGDDRPATQYSTDDGRDT